MKLIYLLTVALCVPIALRLKGMHTPDLRLIQAVTASDLLEVRKLIHTPVDLNVQNSRGETALALAVWHNEKDIAEALIQAHAQLDIQDTFGNTALMWAKSENSNILHTLIQTGAKLDIQDRSGYTALIGAVKTNCYFTLLTLIKAGANTEIKDRAGRNALMWAASYNLNACAQCLINADVNLDAQDDNGDTALAIAAMKGYKNIAQLLINAGAKLYLRDNHNQTALEAAQSAYRQSPETQALLSNAQEITNNVFKLIATPAPDKELKLTNSALYSKQVLELQTALRELKALGATHMIVNLVNTEGNRPLHAALLAQNKYMVQLVVKLMLQANRGESILQANNNGHTPVYLAVIQSPELWLRLLCKFIYLTNQTNLYNS